LTEFLVDSTLMLIFPKLISMSTVANYTVFKNQRQVAPIQNSKFKIKDN